MSKSMSEEVASKLVVVGKLGGWTGGAGVLLEGRVVLRVQGVGVLEERVGFRLEGIERVGLRVGRMEETEKCCTSSSFINLFIISFCVLSIFFTMSINSVIFFCISTT